MGKKTREVLLKSRQAQPQVKPEPGRAPRWIWVVVLAAVLAAAGIRLRLLNLPLERDEGEFAYAGQLILQGIPPYSTGLEYNMKLPGTYAAYAGLMAVFGQTIAGIHLGLIFVTSATTILIFLLARRLFDDYTGAVAAATHAIMALSPTMLALAAHATHFVVLAAVGGLLLLVVGIERRRPLMFLWSGLCLGTAILMKQPGAMFLVFAAAYLVWHDLGVRPILWRQLAGRMGLLLAGGGLPFALTCLTLWKAGVFANFWFWTFDYAREYGSVVPASTGIDYLFQLFPGTIGPAVWLWTIAGVGVLAVVLERRSRPAAAFCLGLAAFSFVATAAGFYWRNHYFIMMIPAVSILAGVAVAALVRLAIRWGVPAALRWIPVGLALAALAYTVMEGHARAVLLKLLPEEACRAMYGGNPFPESIPIARYIEEHTTPDDRIAVLGSEPQIYFYAHRHSATGYIYTYGLMEPQPYAARMQEEMIAEIEAARPAYVVMVRVSVSWLPRPNSIRRIFTWSDRYLAEKYDVVGVADILQGQTVYVPRELGTPQVGEAAIQSGRTAMQRDAEAVAYRPQSPCVVVVLHRKGEAPPAAKACPPGGGDEKAGAAKAGLEKAGAAKEIPEKSGPGKGAP